VLNALRTDDVDRIELFLQHTDDVNRLLTLPTSPDLDPILHHGPSLICAAAFFSAVRCFQFLQLNNADLSIADSGSQTVVHFCAAGGSEEIFDLLDNLGADFTIPGHDGLTCVLYAAKYNRLTFLRRFAARDFDLNGVDSRNRNAVCYACQNDSADVLRFLCEHGVALDYPIRDGEFPVHIALRNGNTAVLAVLRRYSVDLNRTVDGVPALIYAAKIGNAEMLSILSSIPGGNLEVRDRTGWTALHWAASTRRLDLVQILLAAHADVNCLSKWGMTPTHIARNRKYFRVAEFLESRNGRETNRNDSCNSGWNEWTCVPIHPLD
jgi:ankyrin repeat protein